MGKKEFAAVALDPKHETFVIYVTSLHSTSLNTRPRISGLIAEKVPTKVPTKYLDFANIFSPDLVFKFPEHIRINNHAIKLVNSQQPPYGPLYSLGPIELKILKAYIKTNLANGFIKPSKLPTGICILFNQKSNGFFYLSIDY